MPGLVKNGYLLGLILWHYLLNSKRRRYPCKDRGSPDRRLLAITTSKALRR